MPHEAYIGLKHFVEGDKSCITLTKFEDIQESIPDLETSESSRLPAILEWIKGPQIPMPWPLGEGIVTIYGYNFNLDLLPKIEATDCMISLAVEGEMHILVVHLPKCKVLLACRTPGEKQGANLLGRLA